MAKPKKPRRLLAVLAVLAMVLAACGTDSSSDGATDPDAITVVVSTTIWGDIVSNVVGDDANLEVLFPIGADAHDYQLSSAQVASMQEADLVVVNGLALEEGILDAIEGLEDDGANVLEVAGELDPIPFGESSHDHHEEEGEREEEEMASDGSCDPEAGHDDHDEEGHSEGSCDPHVWMDPLRVAMAVELIAEELAAIDPEVDWMANASEYAEELRSLDAEIIDQLGSIDEENRKMVTNHEAFGYFAERYDFEIVGTVIPGGSTLGDPSSAELAELVGIMTDEEINVIFAETVEPAALAEAVADEIGDEVDVVALFTESLGEDGSDAETYVDMLRTNSERIADALS